MGKKAPGRHVATRTRTGLTGALLLTAASTLVPGVAHLCRERRRVGGLLLLLFLALATLIVLGATLWRGELVRMAVQPRFLSVMIIVLAVLAAAWVCVVVWSYRIARPARLSVGGHVVASVTVSALCLVVCAPLLVTANFADAQRGLLNALFPNANIETAPGDDDPWGPNERLNVLLLGGDADPSRPGVRTDVMIVASVDPDTGRTILFSIPRNLQHAPMPFPALREQFPGGYPQFLYGLWRYGVSHPKLVPGTTRPGATLLTATIEDILGLPVQYYALVDLDGFKSLVNALGGVWINVKQPIPYGEHGQFTVKAGHRKLDGRDALWYARSRYQTSDYDRMRRQRCLLGALVEQADPLTVLRNFRELAAAAERTVSTNVPQALLPHLLDLAPKVAGSKIGNVQFVPPLIDTGDPDFTKIRAIVDRTLARAERTAAPSASSPQPTPGESAPAPYSPTPGGSEPPTESQEPSAPGSQRSGANPINLENACP